MVKLIQMISIDIDIATNKYFQKLKQQRKLSAAINILLKEYIKTQEGEKNE